MLINISRPLTALSECVAEVLYSFLRGHALQCCQAVVRSILGVWLPTFGQARISEALSKPCSFYASHEYSVNGG